MQIYIYSQCFHEATRQKTFHRGSSHTRQEHQIYEHIFWDKWWVERLSRIDREALDASLCLVWRQHYSFKVVYNFRDETQCSSLGSNSGATVSGGNCHGKK